MTMQLELRMYRIPVESVQKLKDFKKLKQIESLTEATRRCIAVGETVYRYLKDGHELRPSGADPSTEPIDFGELKQLDDDFRVKLEVNYNHPTLTAMEKLALEGQVTTESAIAWCINAMTVVATSPQQSVDIYLNGKAIKQLVLMH